MWISKEAKQREEALVKSSHNLRSQIFTLISEPLNPNAFQGQRCQPADSGFTALSSVKRDPLLFPRKELWLEKRKHQSRTLGVVHQNHLQHSLSETIPGSQFFADFFLPSQSWKMSQFGTTPFFLKDLLGPTRKKRILYFSLVDSTLLTSTRKLSEVTGRESWKAFRCYWPTTPCDEGRWQFTKRINAIRLGSYVVLSAAKCLVISAVLFADETIQHACVDVNSCRGDLIPLAKLLHYAICRREDHWFFSFWKEKWCPLAEFLCVNSWEPPLHSSMSFKISEVALLQAQLIWQVRLARSWCSIFLHGVPDATKFLIQAGQPKLLFQTGSNAPVASDQLVFHKIFIL